MFYIYRIQKVVFTSSKGGAPAISGLAPTTSEMPFKIYFTTVPVKTLLGNRGKKAISEFDRSLVRASVQSVASHERAIDLKIFRQTPRLLVHFIRGKDLFSTTWETIISNRELSSSAWGSFDAFERYQGIHMTVPL